VGDWRLEMGDWRLEIGDGGVLRMLGFAVALPNLQSTQPTTQLSILNYQFSIN
jgi:hypothetical protein